MTSEQWPALDVECEKCRGKGMLRPDHYSFPHYAECAECDGHGRVPTEFGEAVLAFVLDRLKLSTRVEKR